MLLAQGACQTVFLSGQLNVRAVVVEGALRKDMEDCTYRHYILDSVTKSGQSPDRATAGSHSVSGFVLRCQPQCGLVLQFQQLN